MSHVQNHWFIRRPAAGMLALLALLTFISYPGTDKGRYEITPA